MKTEAFFFGPKGELFGVLDRPSAPRGDLGVVICQPLGHEYVRCHRGCRQLATELAGVGLPALRFDYRGTGDSAGEGHGFGPFDWARDVEAAAAHLRRTCERIALVGLRAGAALAVMGLDAGVAADALVLWQPALDGGAYLAEMRAEHAAHEVALGWKEGEATRAGAPAGTDELVGHAFSHAALEAMATWRFDARDEAEKRPVLVLDGEPEDGAGFWNRDPYEMVIPSLAIAKVREWIEGVAG